MENYDKTDLPTNQPTNQPKPTDDEQSVWLTSELPHGIGQAVPLDGGPDLLRAGGDVEGSGWFESLGQGLVQEMLLVSTASICLLDNFFLNSTYFLRKQFQGRMFPFLKTGFDESKEVVYGGRTKGWSTFIKLKTYKVHIARRLFLGETQYLHIIPIQ